MATASAPSWGSTRASSIPPSCLHRVFRAVEQYRRKIRRDGREVIGLHVGEPFPGPPEEVKEALVQAIRAGCLAYTSAEGMLELREAITAKLECQNHIKTSAEHVLVCPGSTQGLATLMQAIANPGDEILLPAIHWPIYLQQALLAQLRPVFYTLRSDFSVDPEAVADAVTARTRILLINSPANPTGAVFDTYTLRLLLEIARRHELNIISDEAYEDFVYEGKHCSIASLETDIVERERRVFSVFTFSKSHAMTGYRLGYVVAPHLAAARVFRVLQEANIVAPSTPVQFAGLAALKFCDAIYEIQRQLSQARDQVLSLLVEDGVLQGLPGGGWYALLNLERYGIMGEPFAASLLEHYGVAVAPASGFALRPKYSQAGKVLSIQPDISSRYLLRIAFCVDPFLLKQGVDRLRESLHQTAGRRV